jgi:hypothetical protein
MRYIKLGLYAPYIFEVFKPGKSCHVLQIGLGGGALANYVEWMPENVRNNKPVLIGQL